VTASVYIYVCVCVCNEFSPHRDFSVLQRWCTGLGPFHGWRLGSDWTGMNRGGKINCRARMLLNVLFSFVVVVVVVCLTSGAAFLFCSLTPRVSRLTLASKHSGHTRLVLLSKVFEHFAQMAWREREREREREIYFSTLSLLHPAPNKGPGPSSASPSALTAPQDLQWCLRFVKLKLSLQPLHVCFSFSFFLELFWKTCKKKKERRRRKSVKLLQSVQFLHHGRNARVVLCLPFLLSISHDGDGRPRGGGQMAVSNGRWVVVVVVVGGGGPYYYK